MLQQGGSFLAPPPEPETGPQGPTPTTVPVPDISSTGISVPRRPGPIVTTGPGPASQVAPAPSAASAAQPAPPASLPATGTYVYALAGSETATLAGSRSFPPTLTMAVHDSPDLAPDQLAMDVTFSGQHQERQVLARTPAGLAFAFEGGQITFGVATQTSQSSYDPFLLQIPADTTPGSRVAGATSARNPDGSVSRVEDWSVSVVGREVVDVGGTAVDAVVVDVHRQTRAGFAEQLVRDRRYWYDPARAIWVRWHERFRGSRSLGPVDFVYETDYTATLQALPR